MGSWLCLPYFTSCVSVHKNDNENGKKCPRKTNWLNEQTQNDLPVIGDYVMRKAFLDRHGANTASPWKEMYD